MHQRHHNNQITNKKAKLVLEQAELVAITGIRQTINISPRGDYGGKRETMHTPFASNPVGKNKNPPFLNRQTTLRKNGSEVLPLRSMHSLVRSHCSTRPTYCQVSPTCLYTVGLLCTLLHPCVLELVHSVGQGPFTMHSRDAC